MNRIDHILIGAADLDAGIRWVEERLGVAPEPGGSHERWGTRNALLSLGEDCYLEVIAPDPGLQPPAGGILFGLDRFPEPRPLTWVMQVYESVDTGVVSGATMGIDLGEVIRGERKGADGTVLSWTMSDPAADRFGGALPFLIDWGTTPHPGGTAHPGGRLLGITVRHPDAPTVREALETMEAENLAAVEDGPEVSLRFELESPAGERVSLE
jgi:hypothetical protein